MPKSNKDKATWRSTRLGTRGDSNLTGSVQVSYFLAWKRSKIKETFSPLPRRATGSARVDTGRLELPTLAGYASETYAYTNSATCPVNVIIASPSLF